MPFTRDGLWQSPTEQDLDAFRKTLIEEKRQQVNASPQMMQQLVAGLEDSRQAESSNINFFRTVSRLQGTVDIVLPVYGGLHVLKDCIDSIEARTHWPYNLYIVDDASPDPEVIEYLKSLGNDRCTTIFNNKNRGFAATVNRGVGLGHSPYVVILNSDVIVTEGWLTKIVMAMEADPRNVIVNPVTNNTAMINVNMYPGHSYLDMDVAFNRIRNIRYPETMPTGFCLAVRRSVWNECGPFDEAYVSYGEETDFWFKTTRARTEDGVLKGYRAVLADNCYLFHERGTSFSQLGETAHVKQRQAGAGRFNKLHPDFREWQKGYDIDGAVGGLRTKIPPAAFQRKYKGNIAWLVKSAGPCGGMNFITDVVNKLIEEGYNAKVCVITTEKDAETTQLVTAHLHTAPMLFSNPDTFLDEFGETVFTEGKVIASVTELSNLAKALDDRYIGIHGMNHVQSWDMELAAQVNRDDLLPIVTAAYTSLPNLVSSEWVAEEVRNLKAEVTDVILPGVDQDLFHVREREKGDDRFTVGILMDAMYIYKGYDEGVEFCKQLKAAFDELGEEIRIMAVAKDSVPECPYVIGTGHLSQSAMALLMANELDVFVDPARVHSYGLPALEALFSGCSAVTFGNKGEKEYSNWFKDKLFTSDDIGECVDWVVKYRRPSPARKGFTMGEHAELRRSHKVEEFVKCLFPPPEKQFKTRIEVVTPHLRKHGGPTTNIALANTLQDIGHDVSMSMIYTDWNPEVFNMAKIPLRTKWKKMPSDAKVIIINSDNPFAHRIMEANPDKKHIMYKLSHNERFKATENDNLNLGWDHIITSTQWLKDACMAPEESWDHMAWPDEKVTVVGWYHYGHDNFSMPPQNRTYGDATSGFRIGTLVHEHPLKGTELALQAIDGLKKKWEGSMHAVGFGEAKARMPWHWQYLRSVPRPEMAHVMAQLDIWYGASFTEGLGRMSLEAMSAGCAVITTDTGAEFLKHEENCLLYPVGEAQVGAELVDRLVQDRDLMQKLVLNGYDTAKKSADPSSFSYRLNNVIREVLDEG